MGQTPAAEPRRWQILAALACAGAALSAGCGPECVVGTTRCDESIQQTCEIGGATVSSQPGWRTVRPCEIACRMVDGEAHCVQSPEPVADCDGAPHDICFDGSPAQCRGGYPLTGEPCPEGTHCAVASCGPVCVLADTPDPRCSGNPFCDGIHLVTYTCGLIAHLDRCGTDLCHEMSGEGFCTPSPTPDARCGDPARRSSGFCFENTAYECKYGFVIGSYDCTPSVCMGTPGFAPACGTP